MTDYIIATLCASVSLLSCILSFKSIYLYIKIDIWQVCNSILVSVFLATALVVTIFACLDSRCDKVQLISIVLNFTYLYSGYISQKLRDIDKVEYERDRRRR